MQWVLVGKDCKRTGAPRRTALGVSLVFDRTAVMAERPQSAAELCATPFYLEVQGAKN